MNPAENLIIDPLWLANNAVRAMLRTQLDRIRWVRLDSPPGAGKTEIVVMLAFQSLAILKERCMLVTTTNEQAFDLARRLSERCSGRTITLFVRDGLMLPEDLLVIPNLNIIKKEVDLPQSDTCVVIANSEKWSWVDGRPDLFDSMIVDEAFQLPDSRFIQIAGMTRRVVLVGDPGQISPVISCEIERWRHDPIGPHVACPEALLQRHPDIRREQLPVTRRLVQDTVDLIQPNFYPNLPFVSAVGSADRGIGMRFGGNSGLDRAIDLAAKGASILNVEFPSRITGELDEDLADAVPTMIRRMLIRGGWIRFGQKISPISPLSIGVVCAHISQVNAVRERLPVDLRGVFVETADRFQGLERPLMFVHHPLSGRATANTFHLDAGRYCVMLSRHSVACFVLGRKGIGELLESQPPEGNRIPGIFRDPDFVGWEAHRNILRGLAGQGRVVSISSGTKP